MREYCTPVEKAGGCREHGWHVPGLRQFACHLAGTSGLLCLAGQKSTVVIAGILHAMYQDRVPFLGAKRPLEARRRYLTEQFGTECENLVHDYHHFEVERLDTWSDRDLSIKARSS